MSARSVNSWNAASITDGSVSGTREGANATKPGTEGQLDAHQDDIPGTPSHSSQVVRVQVLSRPPAVGVRAVGCSQSSELPSWIVFDWNPSAAPAPS